MTAMRILVSDSAFPDSCVTTVVSLAQIMRLYLSRPH